MYVEFIIDFEHDGYRVYTKSEFKELVLKTAATLGVREVPLVTFDSKGSIGACHLIFGPPPKIDKSVKYIEQLIDLSKVIDNNSSSTTVIDESLAYIGQLTESPKVINNNTSPTFLKTYLSFNVELLNGKTYSFKQIDETIRHELAHLVAYRQYKIDCKHDYRWKKIAQGFGCSGSEILNSGESLFKINPIYDEQMRKHKYFLYCRNCGKFYLETDEAAAFVLFNISCANLGIVLTMMGVNTKSDCCNCDYKLIASVEDLIKDIENGYEETGWTKENTVALLEVYNILQDMLKKNKLSEITKEKKIIK